MAAYTNSRRLYLSVISSWLILSKSSRQLQAKPRLPWPIRSKRNMPHKCRSGLEIAFNARYIYFLIGWASEQLLKPAAPPICIFILKIIFNLVDKLYSLKCVSKIWPPCPKLPQGYISLGDWYSLETSQENLLKIPFARWGGFFS